MVGVRAGIIWVLKRARQVRQMLFGHFKDRRQNEAAALSTMHSKTDWTFLKALSFLSSDYKKASVEFAALTWILRKASTLKYLRLNCDILKPLPSMCNLKHLEIRFFSSRCDMSSCLSSLDNLETLSLHCFDPWSYRPNLCFRGLSRLHSLMLDDFVPGTLTLAESTKLHIKLYYFKNAYEDVWAPLASQLRSLCVIARYNAIAAADELPAFLKSGMSGLRSLTWIANSFGSKQAPFRLHGAFLQVQLLHLRSVEGMYLEIPGGLHHWHRLDIHSESELSIRMQSAPDFANSCQLFSLSYRDLQGLGLSCMLCYMTAKGRPCARTLGKRCLYVHSPGIQLYQDDEDGHIRRLCICGACSSCWKKGSCGPDGILPDHRCFGKVIT